MNVARIYGLAASGIVAVVAAIVVGLGVGALAPSIGPPDRALRGLALGAILVTPGIIGFLGTRRRDRILLAAAGLACLAVSWISYVTLVLVIAGLLFLGAASAAGGTGSRRRWLLVPVLAVLVGGGLVGMLTSAGPRCWVTFANGDGTFEYRDVPEAVAGGPFGGPGMPIGGGCDGGVLTLPGVALGLGLGGGAIAIAWARRRPVPA